MTFAPCLKILMNIEKTVRPGCAWNPIFTWSSELTVGQIEHGHSSQTDDSYLENTLRDSRVRFASSHYKDAARLRYESTRVGRAGAGWADREQHAEDNVTRGIPILPWRPNFDASEFQWYHDQVVKGRIGFPLVLIAT